MEGIDKWLDMLPPWLGTVPQWGMLIVLAIAVVRTSPQWLTVWSTLKLARSNRNRDRIRELEEEVHRCHRECAERVEAVEQKNERLRDEVQGLRDQRNAEQLAIMRAIVRMSGDPAVKQQLQLLESLEAQTKKIEPLKGAEDEDQGS